MTHVHNHTLPLPGNDDEKYIQPMADIFKVLSDPTRIRILSLLAHQEMCVTCIADALGMTEKIYKTLSLPGWDNAKTAISQYVGSKRGYKKNKYKYADRTRHLVEENWGDILEQWGYKLD